MHHLSKMYELLIVRVSGIWYNLPIFKDAPQIWKSVPLLCTGAEEETFKGFLQRWKNSSGEENIDQIIQLFV